MTDSSFWVDKEVIISAWTYNSPKILVLRGIGPQADLQAQSIPIVKDLPGVGQMPRMFPPCQLPSWLWTRLLLGTVVVRAIAVTKGTP